MSDLLFDEIANKGIHIIIEGPDGVGKSTLVKQLRDFFLMEGFEVDVCRNIDDHTLYNEVRKGSLMEHEIAFLSVLDAVRVKAAHPTEPGKVVIQDRWAVMTSVVYNITQITDPNIIQTWIQCAGYAAYYMGDPFIFVLTYEPFVDDPDHYGPRQEEIRSSYKKIAFKDRTFEIFKRPQNTVEEVLALMAERLNYEASNPSNG